MDTLATGHLLVVVVIHSSFVLCKIEVCLLEAQIQAIVEMLLRLICEQRCS